MGQVRVFKSAWFSKAARKAKIADKALCKAIDQVIAGQADDLGGGVFKKRLGDNNYRSILVTKAREIWIFEFLFAKQDRANIDDAELKEFRKLAKAYEALTGKQVEQLIENEDWIEICRPQEKNDE